MLQKYFITYVLPAEHIVYNINHPGEDKTLRTSCEAVDIDAAMQYADRFKSLMHTIYVSAQPFEFITTHIHCVQTGVIVSYNTIQ